ncbi:hypothetical protein SAMN04490220_0024 [Rhodococcus jostii]|uniref:Uncharacterized protein n=1 Tax=Rhodococcus jostii TaxID=132919 RepID=A0A1H4IKH3_RHOJO|nr:hypothetical protein SAMN04490220_0024 [Rhodococcus jostii]
MIRVALAGYEAAIFAAVVLCLALGKDCYLSGIPY